MDSFLTDVEAYARSSVGSEWEAPFHAAFSGGKRVRPRLIWNINRHLGNAGPSKLVPFAAAVEMIHAGSLIHDDLVDGDSTRRGEPSFFEQFGLKQGILFGDYLLAKALSIFAAECRDSFLVGKTAGVLEAMIASEWMEAHGNVRDLPAYWEYIHGKTGALFELCGEIPLRVHARSDATVVPFARAYGLAFQLADDLSEKNWEDEPNIRRFISHEEAIRLFSEKVAELEAMNLVPVENLSFMIPVRAR